MCVVNKQRANVQAADNLLTYLGNIDVVTVKLLSCLHNVVLLDGPICSCSLTLCYMYFDDIHLHDVSL